MTHGGDASESPTVSVVNRSSTSAERALIKSVAAPTSSISALPLVYSALTFGRDTGSRLNGVGRGINSKPGYERRRSVLCGPLPQPGPSLGKPEVLTKTLRLRCQPDSRGSCWRQNANSLLRHQLHGA